MSAFVKQKVVEFLEKKWIKGCPMCGQATFNISDKVFEIREYNDGNLIIGSGPIVPVIPITCENCGHTIFINALLVGAVKRNDGENENEKKE